MAFPSDKADHHAPKRVALYLRVSTGRQAAGDISIPSQRELTTRYCESQGWMVVDEFIEPGASATDDKRPVFQRLMEATKSPDRRFDVICVHSFSRFYRNGAEMEITIRQLRKRGVEVVSMTQPTGRDPAQDMMRQIIGIFDEYTSRENGKNVTRSMRENAKQGFWNGATPPLGYRIVAVEQKGARMKKRLEVDPVDAETVNLIFQLYNEGAEGSGPLGVKDVTKWLNSRGYRTRKGATFGVGPVHGILTNRCYATGKWPYGLRSSRTGQRHDPSEIVEVDIPKIISLDLFDAVQERLKRNNPKVTPPRVVNGPTLLTGIAVCGSCGAGMTRTGTRRGDKTYTYYSCAACHQKGKSVCKGRHVPVAQLDTQVIEGLKEKLFTPERMGKVLSSLRQRYAARDATVVERRRVLKVELNEIRSKLDRLYLAIENGVIELDDDIKGRIGSLKERRDIIEASLARITQNIGASVELDSDRIAKFLDLMQRKLDDGDVKIRRTYLSSVIDRIEVDDDAIRVFGRKDVLADAIAGRNSPAGNVSGFVRKWRARNDSNVRPSDS